MVKFYCVSCREPCNVDKSDVCVRTTKNGRKQLVAKCSCGTKMFKFIKDSDAGSYRRTASKTCSKRSRSKSKSRRTKKSKKSRTKKSKKSRSKKSKKSRSKKSRSRRCPKGSHKRIRYTKRHRSRCVRNSK